MTTATKEKPILFSTPMVRAILDGRKTQTRRIIKDQQIYLPRPDGQFKKMYDARMANLLASCPYGSVGDRLWVRESFDWVAGTEQQPGKQKERFYFTAYRADGCLPPSGKWTPSIHMPRWASRITLEITEVRVERIRDTSPQDIIAEGAVLRSHHCEAFELVGADPRCPVSAFDGAAYPDLKSLWYAGWTKINGADSLVRNDWVFVISFKVLA